MGGIGVIRADLGTPPGATRTDLGGGADLGGVGGADLGGGGANLGGVGGADLGGVDDIASKPEAASRSVSRGKRALTWSRSGYGKVYASIEALVAGNLESGTHFVYPI